MKTQPTALEAAAKALARRDRSAADLTAYLERRGTAPEEAGEAVERLQQAGYVDDGRYAARRAEMQGGGGGRSGATADDDNAADRVTGRRAAEQGLGRHVLGLLTVLGVPSLKLSKPMVPPRPPMATPAAMVSVAPAVVWRTVA